MARTNGSKTAQPTQQDSVATDPEETAKPEDAEDAAGTAIDPATDTVADLATEPLTDTITAVDPAESLPDVDTQTIDDSLNTLKALLSAVEKLQKVRQEVGDIKPLLIRMLDGEVVSGEELEQLKSGVGGLFRLVRAYSDHQTALVKAQPARTLLDQVLKTPG